jgi:hypothetical protein
MRKRNDRIGIMYGLAIVPVILFFMNDIYEKQFCVHRSLSWRMLFYVKLCEIYIEKCIYDYLNEMGKYL